jgi:major curlin subunit
MKFIKVAALAAIVVSGSAMAGLINQGGWGHHGHGGYGGPNSTMNIYQTVAVTQLLPCRLMQEIQSEY